MGMQLRRVLRDKLARESVQTGNATLAVVTGEARVGRAFLARAAVRARASNCRRHEVAAREALPVALDDAEQLVTEHELGVTIGWHAEHAFGDLSVGAAHTDLEHPQQQLARVRMHRRHLGDVRRVGNPGTGDEPLHRQAG